MVKTNVVNAKINKDSIFPLVSDKVKKMKKVVIKEGTYHPKNKLNHLKGNEWLYFTKTILQTYDNYFI